MAFEREHKFEVIGAFPEVARLQADYAALGLELHLQGVREQKDIYYDTPDLALLRAGVALRQRHFGRQTLATYKGSGVVNGSLHTREELELPYSGVWPEAIPEEILAKLEPLGVLDSLEPLIELATARQRFLLVKAGNPQAELTFDEVTSSHEAQHVTFRELELEASPETSESDLEAYAEPLTRTGLTPHLQDKLTRALTLLGHLEAL